MEMIKNLKKRDEKGFTLIELLVVVAIIGILAAIAIPQFSAYREQGFDAQASSHLRNIALAQEAYFAQNAQYASGVADLAPAVQVDADIPVTVAATAAGFTLQAKHSSGGKTFDWDSAITEGQRRVDAPYSGAYGFVETEMSWPITHMVTGTKFALKCNDCHAKGGRLEKVNGFYMPGRDSYAWLTTIGWAAALLTLIGVLVHMFARIVLSNRGR